jgi:hypothetical protein
LGATSAGRKGAADRRSRVEDLEVALAAEVQRRPVRAGREGLTRERCVWAPAENEARGRVAAGVVVAAAMKVLMNASAAKAAKSAQRRQDVIRRVCTGAVAYAWRVRSSLSSVPAYRCAGSPASSSASSASPRYTESGVSTVVGCVSRSSDTGRV